MSELYALYRLHKVDNILYGLKMEAEALDLGKAEKAAMSIVANQYEEIGGRAKALTKEIKSRELEQKAIAEKIAGFEKKLFDGSIVSPREIENLQKEVAMLKDISEKNDETLLGLYDESPPLIEEAGTISQRLEAMKRDIDEKTSSAVSRHSAIRTEFETLLGKRKTLAGEVDKTLLAQYEAVRKRTGSTGVAQVTDDNSCEQCGMSIPVKQRQILKEDKVTLCEGCHRILFMAVLAD